MTSRGVPALLAAACPAVRLATAADRVAGLTPSFVAAPADTGEASAVVRAAAELDLAVVPRGTGTKLDWGCPPERSDLIIDMTRLDRVIEHSAGDLVVTVQAGVGLDELARVLGGANQRLALDPGGGTVGGVLATGAAGPLRLRYGTPRDLLLGITIVRADGIVARSGGKVVKNVAGYDLGKLFAGSYGTLGVITEATFRLHPVPAARRFVSAGYADPQHACRALAAAIAAPLAPVSAELDWPSQAGPVTVTMAVEGDPASVAERASGLADLLSTGTVTAGPAASGGPATNRGRQAGTGAGPVPDVRPEPPAWWGATPVAPGGTLIQVAFWAGILPAVVAAIATAAPAAGAGISVRGSGAAGLLQVAVPAAADPAGVARFGSLLRAAIGGISPGPAWILPPADPAQPAVQGELESTSRPAALGSVVALTAPPGVRELIDPWGPVSSLPLMTALKRQFDPQLLMAPGRLPGTG